MSSASAAVSTTSSAIPLPTSSNAALETETVSIQATVQSLTVTFTWIDGPNPHWSANVSPVSVELDFNVLASMRWTLVVPPNVASNEVSFLDPPITFPGNQQLAPMVVYTDPLANPHEVEALWTNVDRNRVGVYHYTVNALVNGQVVTHDPTVENIPPTP